MTAAKALKVGSPKAKAKAKKKATISWKKVAKAKGYEVQYGLKKNFKGAKKITIKKNKTVKKTISKLKAGSRYFVRIRPFTKVKNPTTGKTETVYGKWSKTLKFRAKN